GRRRPLDARARPRRRWARPDHRPARSARGPARRARGEAARAAPERDDRRAVVLWRRVRAAVGVVAAPARRPGPARGGRLAGGRAGVSARRRRPPAHGRGGTVRIDDLPHTRRAILNALKRGGPATSAELAERLGITGEAVRQHLKRLEADGAVAL